MNPIQRLKNDYPWIQTPLIVGAPMRLIALADLAVEISKAGGIGFIGAGTDTSTLASELQKAKDLLAPHSLDTRDATLPIGVGFINWGASLSAALPVIKEFRPAAVWFFAPSSTAELKQWVEQFSSEVPRTRIWVQIGSVRDAVEVNREVAPDVLVVQGTDAGGHGLARGAGLVSLLPEVHDAILASPPASISTKRKEEEEEEEEDTNPPVLLAAGGIADPRGAAAALVLGASGVVMGTRFLLSHEAVLAPGYRAALLHTTDGGQTTARSKVWDFCRGTTGWSEAYNGRGVVNRTWLDGEGGIGEGENRRLYEECLEKGSEKGEGWGKEGRLCMYAGAAVGLCREVMEAGEIVREVREGAKKVVEGGRARL